MLVKNCSYCDNTFHPVKSNQKFCSKKCLKQFHNNKNKVFPIEKICKICHKTFYTKVKKTLFCSYECRAINQRQKYKTANRLGTIKQCTYCKSDFILKKGNQKFCSNACLNLHTKDKKKSNITLSKKVSVTNKAFKLETASINELLDEFGFIE
jgi:predicted nucleic acid-binding Zn ribbon protein